MDFQDLEVPVKVAIWGMNSKARELAQAFKTSQFVYGTQGSNVISKVIGRFVDGLQAKAVREKTVHDASQSPERLRNVFDPGFRAKAYVHGVNSQMMDLYYGQYGTTTYQQRNELIGEFVHRAMNFSGTFDIKVPGYEAYWNTFGRVPSPNGDKSWHPGPYYEGWEKPPDGDHPRKKYDGWFYPNPDAAEPNAGMSATKYMSRVIRAGIMYFGGTLLYDGAEVYYESVFSKRAGVRDSDTAMEARALLPFFAAEPGKSSVRFGNGTMVFHWFGRESVPVRALFKENWMFAGGSTHRPANALSALKVTEEFSELWERFPEDDPRNPRRQAQLESAVKYAKDAERAHYATAELSPESAQKLVAFARRVNAKKKSAGPP